jgi:hypothetical protein
MKLEIEIKDDDIRGLLCSAFEGGSNYWYANLDYSLADITLDQCRPGGQYAVEGWEHPFYVVPFLPGCALTLTDSENSDPTKVFRLDRESLERGVKVMAEKYPHHLAEVLRENADADTGDVFLQCCLFGELVYG